jgi:electron-transferring-flavoprotein dehydrogenase
MEFDVLIIGAGPSGLAAACRLRQLSQQNNQDLSICVVEKGSEVGAHILSGAVLETRAMDELFPNWKEENAPITTEVTSDEIYYLTSEKSAIQIPSIAMPKTMHNDGNYIVSLGNVCRWLAEKAEELGVDVFPGFPAGEIIYNDDGSVGGVITQDMGLAEDGSQKDSFMPGMILRAKYTLFSEGCRGHLGKQLIEKFNLSKGKDPQHYGIGIKEIWQIPPEQHQQGLVVHTTGWPLSESNTTGGSFLYHIEDNQVALALITDLAYKNPHLSPFEEMQRYKTHPKIKQYLDGGTRISYGARAVVKGGIQSLPKMSFPGGLLLGDNAGTLNMAKIKGSHTAMKSGMVAAEVVFNALSQDKSASDLTEYKDLFEQS